MIVVGEGREPGAGTIWRAWAGVRSRHTGMQLVCDGLIGNFSGNSYLGPVIKKKAGIQGKQPDTTV